jgi:hypothetical protein
MHLSLHRGDFMDKFWSILTCVCLVVAFSDCGKLESLKQKINKNRGSDSSNSDAVEALPGENTSSDEAAGEGGVPGDGEVLPETVEDPPPAEGVVEEVLETPDQLDPEVVEPTSSVELVQLLLSTAICHANPVRTGSSAVGFL